MKAQTATAPVAASLEETLKEKNSEISRLQALRTQDELELRKVVEHIELKKMEADRCNQAGDKAGRDRFAAQILELEWEDKRLRAKLEERDREIIPLRREIGELTRIRIDEERSQKFDAACDAARVATDNFLTLYAELTKAAGELACASAELLTWGQEGASANARLVLDLTFNPNHPLAAQGWKIPPYAARYVREFFVRGMLPPVQKSSSNGHGK
jgi:hypothetical protein